MKLTRGLNTCSRNPILESLSWSRKSAVGEWIRVREVFRHEPQLDEDGCLIPGDVFVVQTIAADVDHRCKGDADRFAGWGDSGESVC